MHNKEDKIVVKKQVRIIIFVLILVISFNILIPGKQASANSDTVRVKISMKENRKNSMTVRLDGDYTVSENSKISLKKGSTYTISVASSNNVRIYGNGVDQVVGSSLTLARKSSSLSNLLRVYDTIYGDINYLGNMRFTVSSGELVVVNHVPLEQYLYGVVAYEMSNSFPLEALKAQAVCARGYAVKRIKTSGTHDIGDTTSHQVYKGYNSSYSRVKQAVDETQGEVLTYNGQIIDTYYAASNGGQTELPGNTWGGGSAKNKQYPYLAQRDDPYDLENPSSLFQRIFVPATLDSYAEVHVTGDGVRVRSGPSTNHTILETVNSGTRFPWISTSNGWHKIQYKDGQAAYISADYSKKVVENTGTYTNPVLNDLQSKAYEQLKGVVSNKKDIIILSVDRLENDQARWPGTGSRSYVTAKADITVRYPGTNTKAIKGLTLQLMNKNASGSYVLTHEYLDSRLRLRGVEKAGSDGYYVTNGRYGHGVGMSQRGAQTMAANHGKTYRDILYFYFKDTVLSSDMGEIPMVSNSKHAIKGTNITGLSTSLNVSTFLSNIKVENGTAQLLAANNKVKSSGTVATGDKLQVKYQGSNNVYRTYNIVIYGDVNGDGKISLIDLLYIQRHLLNTKKTSGVYTLAADVSKDGKIALIDLLMVQRHLLGTAKIKQ